MKQFVSQGGFILGQTAWEESVPWLRPDATQYIRDYLTNGCEIFEWGMGASTIWFLRLFGSVISIERDSIWFDKVNSRIKEKNLAHGNMSICFSDIEQYADFILGLEDNYFDLILIDGRNRCRCLGNALSKVKIGGMLCLDNSERPEYAKAVALMDTWDGYEWGDENWKTAIWHRSEYSIVDRIEFPNEDA